YPGNQGINYLSGALDKDLPDADFGDRIQAANLTGVFSYQYGKWTLFPDVLDPVSQISVI
ncbi:MAG: hypothetical protein GWN30_01955, partial [Gammaproteobacteria bacterium]|nr:hypothetical protein [Gammaproteobacteria bacterium]